MDLSGTQSSGNGGASAGSEQPRRCVAASCQWLAGQAVPTIRIYIHPGRAFVGQIEPERLEEQFDLASARWFPSLGEAELAAEGRSGFLVEIKGAFTDLDGRRRGRAGLFVPALRR